MSYEQTSLWDKNSNISTRFRNGLVARSCRLGLQASSRRKRGQRRRYAQFMLLRSMGLCTATTDVSSSCIACEYMLPRQSTRYTMGDQMEDSRQSDVGSVARFERFRYHNARSRGFLRAARLVSSSTNPISGYSSRDLSFLGQDQPRVGVQIPSPD